MSASMFDRLNHAVGTMISWMGQAADGRLSRDDCEKLIAMLPSELNTDQILAEAMALHEEADYYGLTASLAQRRKALLKRWKQMQTDAGGQV